MSPRRAKPEGVRRRSLNAHAHTRFYSSAHFFVLRARWTRAPLIKKNKKNPSIFWRVLFVAECSSTLTVCSQATEFWELLQTLGEELRDVTLLIFDQLFLIGRDLKRWTSYTHFCSSQFEASSSVCVCYDVFAHFKVDCHKPKDAKFVIRIWLIMPWRSGGQQRYCA